MSNLRLPPVDENKRLEFPHFPSRFHAAVFRLWETVSAERIAFALGVSLCDVTDAANAMGLPPQSNTDCWEARGYITTIRNAWHILPYEQLLPLLGCTEEQLAMMLKEDDFLSVKLGNFKPYCAPVTVTPLDKDGEAQLSLIRETVKEHFSDLFSGNAPFDFFTDLPESLPQNGGGEGIRMIYSYCGLYASALEYDIAISYPETMLRAYAALDVNAVWLPVVLYQVTPFPFAPHYSEGWEKRCERLRTLVALAEKYGIKVYLYLNEPRSMPLAFFEAYPELQGSIEKQYAALCMSDPRVLSYLRSAVRTLCKNVPGLGGFFVITCSENLTHCKSRKGATPCHRCAETSVATLVSDVLIAISEESRIVDPSIRTIAWTWAWESYMSREEITECIGKLPKEIILQSNSEAMKTFTVGGVKGTVSDYSMSIPGPAETAKFIWDTARKTGHEVSAKVQVNVTWECSTVPFLPVYDLIREHMKGLRETGVSHLMLSWTLGGYPSFNLKVASDCLCDPSEERYDALLKAEFGAYAATVKKAASTFSDAFREFPFHIGTLYKGPQNAGPSNLLYRHPSGWNATMTCYAYDDLTAWRSIYPESVFLSQLGKLSDGWAKGMELLSDMPDCSFKDVAAAAYTVFRSSYLQTAFILARNENDAKRMLTVVREEKELALTLYRLMTKNSQIGYEAANHYYYNKGMLMEKVLSCTVLESTLAAECKQ